MRANQILFILLLCVIIADNAVCQSSMSSIGISSEPSEISMSNKAPFGTETVIIKQPETFPQSWFGEYQGTLNIYKSDGLAQSIPMKMIMGKTDTAGVYRWNIIYGDDAEKGLRPYLLRTIDAKKGVYQCDELNSIKMESYFVGNKLFCHYAVEGNDMTTVEEKSGDTFTFEIIFGKDKSISETGGKKEQATGENIPPVKTFPVVIYQKAVLKKVKL